MRKKKYNPGDLFICIFNNPFTGSEIKTVTTITDYNQENNKYEIHSHTYVNNNCETTVNGKLNISGLRFWTDSRELTEFVRYQKFVHYPICQ